MYETIRAALKQAVVDSGFAAAFPGVPVVYDNDPFDWGNPPERFVNVVIEFQGGAQIGMSSSPKTRVHGHAYICVYTREGLGAKVSAQIQKHFHDTFKYRTIGASHLQEPEPMGSDRRRGFYIEDLKVSFYADEA